MIKPLIQPRRISRPMNGIASNPISRGLIVAAKNSVNKVQESTQTISKGLNKNEKFAMNYVEFFGSKKTTKILKKNLKSVKNSLMSTFAMAKALKKNVGGMAKSGGIGGFLGGVGGFLGKGLFGKAILISLIGLATGGIAYILYKNAAKFFEFLRDKRDQLAPIIESIIARYVEGKVLPAGVPQLTDELSSNVDIGVQNLLEKNPDMDSSDAIKQVVKENIDFLQKEIDALVEERKQLNKIVEFSKVLSINNKIQRLEAGQKYLKTGDKFLNPISSFLFKDRLSGTFFPQGYNEMTTTQRLNTVVAYVESSPKSLEALNFEVSRAASMGGGSDAKVRFYEDVLNYIKAVKANEKDSFIKNKQVLPESFDVDATRKENIKEFEKIYGDVLNYSPSNKKGNKIKFIQSGSGNKRGSGARNNSNSGETLTSSTPDSGIIDIAFYSPLNNDLAMERGSSRNTLNLYMG